MTEQQTTPTPAPPDVDEAATPVAPADEPRYAAYDKTYLRFLDGVHDTKAAATKAAKAAGVKSYEIRKGLTLP